MAGILTFSKVNLVSLRFSGLGRHAVRAFSVSSARQDAIGFIGLGNMGGHMANNLIRNGKDIIVFDMVKENVSNAVKAGAKAAATPAEVVAEVKQCVTMLPASQHVREVYTGNNGIFSAVQSGTLLIDSSTIDPSVSQEMEIIAKEKNTTFMDAPVSGGVNAARDALLTFMVGGDKFPEAEAILKMMGKNIVHCGAVGTGQAAKICNNMLLGISMIGTSETMNLGIRLGLDPKLLAKILNMSSGRCWSSEVYNPCPGVLEGVPSSNDYKGGFGTALMTKDLGLAQNAATATQAAIPMGALAHQLYRVMTQSGYGGKDFSSAFEFMQDQNKKDS